MQQDRTRIAIRERGFLSILDLSLQVIRTFFGRLMAAWLMATVPLMLLNWWLVGWMVADVDRSYDPYEIWRYIFHYLLLVFAETPLMSIPIVGILGPAIFMEQPNWRQIFRGIWRFTPHLILTLLVLRGIGFIWVFCGLQHPDQTEGWAALEGFMIFIFFCYTAAFHALRPFVTEIILLEKLPLWAGKTNAVSLHRRSNILHTPASQTLIGHWLISLLVGTLLIASFTVAVFVLVGVLINEWGVTFVDSPIPVPGTLHYWWILPLPLFMVSGFFAVARFLSYLDVRIRNEGWEVGLLLIAEGERISRRIGV